MEREDKRVAQLWGGRFTKETDKLVYNFNASISFDQKLYKQDMEGSIAHVKMLGKQGILTEKEMQDIVDCLKEILKEVEEGKLIITRGEIRQECNCPAFCLYRERCGNRG